MKLIIDIDEQHFELLQMAVMNGMGDNAQKIIAQGTPIPDNATNGDVIKVMFPNIEIKEIGTNGGLQKPYEYRCDNREDLIFRALAKWWNAPYQKGGNE